jgi:phosphohistidine swiveling domain-containing protein
MAAEWALGAPQDVEWAMTNDRLWLLQSRPITGLPPELRTMGRFPLSPEDAERARAKFWRVERMSLERVSRPLEHDLLASCDRTQQLTGLWNGEKRLWRYETFNGRGYFTPFELGALGGHKRVAEAAAGDLGTRLRESGVTPWQHYAPEVIKATERLRAFDAAAADGPKLADHLEDALAAHHRHWAIHWLMVSLFGKAGEPYEKAIEKVTGLSGEAAKDAGARLLEGEETALTRLIDRLYELGASARADDGLAAVLRDPPSDPLGQLAEMPGGAALRERLEALLDEFGERVGIGFGSAATFETKSWREDPRPALALAAAYLDPAIEPPAARRERARGERDAEVERLCAACQDAEAVAELRRWLPYARTVATDLEEHNHYVDQMTFGQLRHALGAAGAWLATKGVLRCADDLFWLKVDELLGALRSDATGSMAALVEERAAQAARWAELTPPPVMGPPPSELDPRREYKEELTAPVPEDARQLKGQAASRGHHRGRARVVAMTEVLPSVSPGDVLVAENAGPQWTPLFPILGAIVLDQGVLTQHAATTAREYGIPAVLRTNVATRRIKDGAWVTVDGDAGTVEIEGD